MTGVQTCALPISELRKEGESGRRKISKYTRYSTVVLATLQAVGISTGLPNMLPGLVPNLRLIYLILALQKGFYGEVLTTLYFTIMQPIGLLVWIYQGQFKKEKQEFVARKLDAKGWTKYLSLSVLW